MAYTKTNWQTGDTITAAKLNNMENGIEANNGFLVTLTFDEETSDAIVDKTNAEIYAAWQAGKMPILGIFSPNSYYNISDTSYEVNSYFQLTDINETLAVFMKVASTPEIDGLPKSIQALAIEILTADGNQTVITNNVEIMSPSS